MSNNYAQKTMDLMATMSEERQKVIFDCATALNVAFNKMSEKKENAPVKAEAKEDQQLSKRPKVKLSPYEKNKTMRLIGKQNLIKYISDDAVWQGLLDIADARANYSIDPYEAIVDGFMYGCITGKREIRAKKKATI